MERIGATRTTALAIATAAALLTLVAQPPRAASSTAVCEEQAGETALALRVIELVNAHRRSRGLREVRIGPALVRAARWKASHMARYGYVAHLDLPGRRTLAQRLRSCGFEGSGWGEVLAAGQRWPRAVVRAWLSSPSHRAVIEARWSRLAGAGAARSRDGTLYWVLDFGA